MIGENHRIKYPSKHYTMKYSIQKVAIALTLVFAVSSLSAYASQEVLKVKSGVVEIGKDHLVGGWEYTAEGAPQGYESGLLMIVKTGDVYKVQVQLAGGAMNGTDVVVKGNDITFKLNIEGESVSVSLSAKGSQISGTSTSASGTYTIKGVKSISPQ